MTEAEWLVSERPGSMLDVLKVFSSTRKFRLFGVACVNRFAFEGGELRRIAVVVEAWADGQQAFDPSFLEQYQPPSSKHNRIGSESAWYVAGGLTRETCAAGYAKMVVENLRRAEGNTVAAILRDIFGNPFRSVAFSPSWRTDTAVALARQMYDAREFSAMPILADALQDAGCDSADVLDHCRGPGPHVRGCWVVDLVLGKE